MINDDGVIDECVDDAMHQKGWRAAGKNGVKELLTPVTPSLTCDAISP